MATLQAARARALGLPAASARSWGLNRAIFYAAAKRGFRPRPPAGEREPGAPRPRAAAPVAFHLGEDKAYAASTGRAPLFVIGGQVQTPEDFARQIERRFAGTFRSAWSESLRIVRGYPKSVLTSPPEFYDRVYRPRRDELARRWTERAAARTLRTRTAAARRPAPRRRRAD